ncbi:MAG: methylmalonyl-CoA epimerase [Candidatus Bathyarchaeota archaeon]|nr:MAG: methylmalonyl-CoA epimerase [Candidatus Bathyarchaeota archaeon]
MTAVDHIGVAVEKIEDLLPFYEKTLGLSLEEIKESKTNKVRGATLQVGETRIELLEPLGEDSPLANFLRKKGEGIHHIAFAVSDLEKVLKQLKRGGVALIDETPRIGIKGDKIAFLHPKATGHVLIELCEEQ